jgi:hypothetical protein
LEIYFYRYYLSFLEKQQRSKIMKIYRFSNAELIDFFFHFSLDMLREIDQKNCAIGNRWGLYWIIAYLCAELLSYVFYCALRSRLSQVLNDRVFSESENSTI